MSRPDIILLTIDSLRADSVSFLDDDAPSTPTIDEFATDATLATTASAPSSHTRASVPALLTSRYAHHFFSNFLQDINTPTIAQRLSDVGYDTAAFHSNPLLSRHFGYDRGFDTFFDGLQFVEETHLPETAIRLYSKAVRLLRRFPYQPAEEITERAVNWLTDHDDDTPVFLWVHYMDPHGPYALNRDRGYLDKFRSEQLWHKAVSEPNAVTDAELQRLREAYNEEIRHTDQQLKSMFEAITSYTDDVCVVLTGDHGEEFREHGEFTHMPKLYEVMTRVPFILDLPTTENLSPPEPISLLDIVPTLVGQIENLEAVPAVGLDLTASEADREYVVMETNPDSGDALVGLRGERYKYIAGGSNRELYDLSKDPEEHTNLVAHTPKIEDKLKQVLSAHLTEHDFDCGDKLAETAGEMNSEMKGRLEDLGYL